MAKPKREYTVVARRYRPQQLADLVGQEPIAQALRNALTAGRVAHAYLFTGARGVGKTSTARILAKALNCVKGPTPTPCDKCSACEAIAAGEDIDVREIDGASNRGIDEIRAIRQDVATRPTRSRYKIYIIDEVHMLTAPAFNALLKTLEEPPPHVKFIFATTEVQKIPVTILSRCQRFDFATIGAGKLLDRLREVVAGEGMQADEEALELIARRAGGSMRDAQSLLDQLLAFSDGHLTGVIAQRLLGIAPVDRVIALADAILANDPQQTIEQLSKCESDGLQSTDLLDQLIDHWTDLMLIAGAGSATVDLNTPQRFRETLAKQAASRPLDTILAGLDILVAAKTRLRGGSHTRTLVQMALIRLSRLEDLTPLSQLALWFSTPPAVAATGASPRPASPNPRGPQPALGAQPPEAKKKPDVTLEKATITAETLPVIWPEILAQAGSMLGGSFAKGALPAILGPNTLVIRFPADYNAAYDYCSNPTHKERLEAVIQRQTGQTWQVKLEKSPPPADGAAPVVPNAVIQRQKTTDLVQQVPLLKEAIAVLDARVIRIDPEFGSDPLPPRPVADDTEEP
jgi:DNA polymerase-3 subunit gamma/tau